MVLLLHPSDVKFVSEISSREYPPGMVRIVFDNVSETANLLVKVLPATDLARPAYCQ